MKTNNTSALSVFAIVQLQLVEGYMALKPHWPRLMGLLAVALVLVSPETALAQAMPWEGALEAMATAMTGPWLKWVAIIAIAVGGVLFGIGELNGPFKYMLQLAAGFSVAIGAAALAGMLIT